MSELREDGRPFDAIDRLIARVGLEGPLAMAEAAMERHDALLAVVDAAEKVTAFDLHAAPAMVLNGAHYLAVPIREAHELTDAIDALRAAVDAAKGTT